MHEARAVAEVVRAAETVSAGRRLTRLGIRVEGDEHVTAEIVRTHVAALTARTHPGLQVRVDVDPSAAEPAIRLVSISVEE